MKRDISEFVMRCLICQQVKAEHQVPSGLLQPMMIPEWKWDRVTMDFVSGLPLTPKKKNVVWAVVDRLMKLTHFISCCQANSDWRSSEIASHYQTVILVKYDVVSMLSVDNEMT
ncbi:integrase [Gossypium australe]|uniref:Integrase n=1 Tax=Gossypium australe TaxID=47621 RepID=A0A5B6WRF6_9ROSI|nr:integrase [Gossypium australe]